MLPFQDKYLFLPAILYSFFFALISQFHWIFGLSFFSIEAWKLSFKHKRTQYPKILTSTKASNLNFFLKMLKSFVFEKIQNESFSLRFSVY